jgi:hypothetical protein
MTNPSTSDTDLIDRLAELGEQLERELLDMSADLPDAVVARIRAGRTARSVSDVTGRRATLWSLAAAVVLLVVVLVVLPGPRHTIARWFGVGSVRIDPVPTPASSAPSTDENGATATTATTATSGAGSNPDPLGLGPAVGPDEAVAATGLPLPVATAIGTPESFHLPGGPQIVARYDVDGRTVLVGVLAGTTDEPGFFKQASSEQITAVDVPVDGGSVRGVWIDGEPHTFGYLDADGEPGTEPLRLAGDTLLWERGDATLRVEGARDLAEALEIARSMEP